MFLKGAEVDSNHMIERSVKLYEQNTGEFKCRNHLVYIIVSAASEYYTAIWPLNRDLLSCKTLVSFRTLKHFSSVTHQNLYLALCF